MAAAPKTFDPHGSSTPAKRRVNPWLIAAVVSLAAFMEVLDTAIANVALPYMAGGLAASVDDASWVLTSYLIANAVVLPISGWLSIWLGRKRFYMACVVIFTISSFLCGIAPSLGMLILFRVIQGAGGGGLQPVSQAILRDTFPPEQLGTAFAVYGMVIVAAPAIGPTVGGWITDNYQWRWIFYMNVPVGMLSLLLVSHLIEDPAYLSEQIRKARRYLSIDYIGIGLLALCLGSLQVVLDKGQEDDWFHSPMIAMVAVIFPVALVLFIAWESTRSKPVMDLRMFKNPNFAAAAAMIFVFGLEVYAITVLTPQFVQAFMGYKRGAGRFDTGARIRAGNPFGDYDGLDIERAGALQLPYDSGVNLPMRELLCRKNFGSRPQLRYLGSGSALQLRCSICQVRHNRL
jgi:DHA2 family multidrug resistance protein